MNKITFILSTGRTGTQFFRDYINNSCQNAQCLHEPKPSRHLKFLSNLYLQDKLSDSAIYTIYKKSRGKVFKKLNGIDHYIESSNFMFGCIPALNKYISDLKILHLVRDPFTYIQSHLNHGFWHGYKKFTAKYVPYWIENLNLKKECKDNPVYLLAARWIYVNRQISAYDRSNPYMLVRFEDLFNNNRILGAQKLSEIRDFLELESVSIKQNEQLLRMSRNASRKNVKWQIDDNMLHYLITNGNDLLKKYGYNLESVNK